MLGLVYAMVFLLNTALEAVGIVLELSFEPNAPVDSSLLGTTAPIGGGALPGAYVLKMTRGSGPTLHTYFTGHWLVNST